MKRLMVATLGAFALAIAAITASAVVTDQDVAVLRAADPPPNGVFVDSLDLSRAAIRRPRAARGQPTPPPPLTFALGGDAYPHAVPLQANADLAIDLKGQALRFLSMVGIDDERKAGVGSVIFGVWVDGKKIVESGLMRAGDAPKPISVDLAGAKRLVLAVSDGGDGTRDDSADWGGALILMAQGAGVRPETTAVPVPGPRVRRWAADLWREEPAAGPHAGSEVRDHQRGAETGGEDHRVAHRDRPEREGDRRVDDRRR
jgi:hypothetical protein